MNFIKRHKLLTIFIGLILVFIVLVSVILFQLLGGHTKDAYGNRLNNIDKVEIAKTVSDKLEKEITEDEFVIKTDYVLKGRLINILIELKDETELDKAKEIGNRVITYFTEEELSYYDIQVLVKSDNDKSEKYPIIGYKHKTREAINWD